MKLIFKLLVIYILFLSCSYAQNVKNGISPGNYVYSKDDMSIELSFDDKRVKRVYKFKKFSDTTTCKITESDKFPIISNPKKPQACIAYKKVFTKSDFLKLLTSQQQDFQKAGNTDYPKFDVIKKQVQNLSSENFESLNFTSKEHSFETGDDFISYNFFYILNDTKLLEVNMSSPDLFVFTKK